MNKVKAIFLKEYLERVRRRSFFIGLLLVPLFMAIVVIVPIWLGSVEEESSSRVVIVETSGLYKADLEAAIQSELPSGERRFRYLDRNESDLRILGDRLEEPVYLDALLDADLLDWYLIIPASSARVDTLEFHGRVVSNLNLIALLDSHYTQLRRRERLRALELPPGLLDEIDVGTEIRTFQQRSGETSEAGFLALWGSTFLMVMILYMTIMGFGVMIQRSILEDKNLHVTEVVLSSMSASRFLAGKVLGIGAVGLTQYLAWLVMASLLTALIPLSRPEILASVPAVQPMSYLYFVLFYILGFLLFSGLLAAVAAICTTDQEAQQYMQPIILLLILPLIMMIYIFQNPDAPIAVVMSLIPVFTPLVMFMRINVSAPPLWQILLALGLMLVSLILTFAVAGRIFRVGILMTGKRASLVEALRWVRQP